MPIASATGRPGAIPNETIQALCELIALPERWDSYAARPIDPQAVLGALWLLLETMTGQVPPPHVVPTSNGRVLLEWHRGGVDLEIEVLSPRRFEVTFEDAEHGIEWERELGPDLSPLSECFERLACSREAAALTEEPAHAEVVGRKTNRVKRTLATRAVWVIPPPASLTPTT